MNLHHQRVYEMLIRARDFRTGHQDAIARSEMATQVFDDLDRAIATVENRAEGHISMRGKAKRLITERDGARAAVWKRMRAIVVTGRGAELAGALKHFVLRMPSAPTNTELAIEAHSFANYVEQDAAVFIARGMPTDFVSKLRNEADTLEASRVSKDMEMIQAKSARTSLGDDLRVAFNVVRQLDGITLNLFADDEAALAEWKVARRVEWWQRPGRRKKKVESRA